MHEHQWKTLSSKEIFVHPKLTITSDEIVLPNGRKTEYLLFNDLHDGVGVICRKEGLIMLQYEYAYPMKQSIIQFPEGWVESGETTEAAANRELIEEAGFSAGKLTLLGTTYLAHRRSTAREYIYLAEDLTAQLSQRDFVSKKTIETFWRTEAQIDVMIADGKIQQSGALAAWSLYRAKKDQLL